MSNPGIVPVEFRVLVKPHKTEDKTQAGLFIPEVAKERQDLAQVKADIIAIGGNAFEDWKGLIPSVGDTVFIAKYAGDLVKGKDGEDYRLLNDKDIAGVMEV